MRLLEQPALALQKGDRTIPVILDSLDLDLPPSHFGWFSTLAELVAIENDIGAHGVLGEARSRRCLGLLGGRARLWAARRHGEVVVVRTKAMVYEL